MINYYQQPGVAVHNGHIYVARGKSFERYDPQRNMWSQLCSLKGFYKTLVSLDNKLWTIWELSILSNACVSVYDEYNDRWKEKCSTPNISMPKCFVVPESLLSDDND
nr:uncharacterized protein LOC118682865 [Bactrocera oleae]